LFGTKIRRRKNESGNETRLDVVAHFGSGDPIRYISGVRDGK
jgi:hypothetical protein